MPKLAAAEAMGTVFILSIVASCTIEELGKAVPNGNNWLQLYVYADKLVGTHNNPSYTKYLIF